MRLSWEVNRCNSNSYETTKVVLDKCNSVAMRARLQPWARSSRKRCRVSVVCIRLSILYKLHLLQLQNRPGKVQAEICRYFMCYSIGKQKQAELSGNCGTSTT